MSSKSVVYVLCMMNYDADGEKWYEPTAVFTTRASAEAEGDKRANNYHLVKGEYRVEEMEVQD